jgi:cytochrome c
MSYPCALTGILLAAVESAGPFNDITTVRNTFNLRPLGAMLCLVAMGSAQAQSPSGRGALLFQTCAACHNVLGDGIGPDLTGIYGQKAARNPNYSYSEALRASNLVWDEPTLKAFIRDPQSLVKGTKMAFPGYADDADVEAVLAYLKNYR